MHCRRLYVFDIDGTILTTEHKILPSTKLGMQLIKQSLGQIILASARPPKAIEPIVEELDLEPFYIALNGALVVRSGQFLFEGPMGSAVVQEAVQRGLNRGLSVNVYSSWDWFIQEPNFWSTREGDVVGFQGTVRDLKTVEKAHKLLFLGKQEAVADFQKELDKCLPEVEASRSNPDYLEVVGRGVSKARALQVVSDLTGTALKQAVVFGDGENDLPMLLAAGLGVAMGNAHPSLKEAAHLVTGTNNQDGVLTAVRKILDRGCRISEKR